MLAKHKYELVLTTGVLPKSSCMSTVTVTLSITDGATVTRRLPQVTNFDILRLGHSDHFALSTST